MLHLQVVCILFHPDEQTLQHSHHCLGAETNIHHDDDDDDVDVDGDGDVDDQDDNDDDDDDNVDDQDDVDADDSDKFVDDDDSSLSELFNRLSQCKEVRSI